MGQIILFLIINCSAQELESIMFAEYSVVCVKKKKYDSICGQNFNFSIMQQACIHVIW